MRTTTDHLSEGMRNRIERCLLEWHDTNSETRKRYEAASAEWQEKLQPLQDAIIASEQLTHRDYEIRIT